MTKIPKISFYKKSKSEIEFEIFSLSSLFKRRGTFKHPLDQPHRVEFYIILFFTKGIGSHFIDFKKYTFRKGSMLFISKGQVQSYEVSPDSDGFLVLFTESFLSKNLIHSEILSLYRLYNYHLHSPALNPEETGEDNFIGIINDMYKEYNHSNNFAKEEILRLLVKLFLLKVERIKNTLIPRVYNSEMISRFISFRDQLENNFTKTRNISEYAEMLNISYKYLNEICKSVTGITAKQFVDNYIVLEIKRQLATTDISVKELAYEFGFDEPTNFIKFFKKHTLQTPSQFKNTIHRQQV
ncbi:MAG: helix-turn-helix transcriptional regulator [Desulfobacteraceae bacterium]|jgi:AraC-like DNA-binding protein